jgi:hypothetical protein
MIMLKSKHEKLISKEIHEKNEALKELGALMNDKDKDIKILENKVSHLFETREEIYNLLEERERKINILKFFSRCNYDKDVARYEAIEKRTKNTRIREKAKKKILDLKEQKLAFE